MILINPWLSKSWVDELHPTVPLGVIPPLQATGWLTLVWGAASTQKSIKGGLVGTGCPGISGHNLGKVFQGGKTGWFLCTMFGNRERGYRALRGYLGRMENMKCSAIVFKRAEIMACWVGGWGWWEDIVGDRRGCLRELEILGQFSSGLGRWLCLGGFRVFVGKVRGVLGTGELEIGVWVREKFMLAGK